MVREPSQLAHRASRTAHIIRDDFDEQRHKMRTLRRGHGLESGILSLLHLMNGCQSVRHRKQHGGFGGTDTCFVFGAKLFVA